MLNLFLVVWMNLSLRNVSSTLKSNLKTAKSARQWRSSFPSGMYSSHSVYVVVILTQQDTLTYFCSLFLPSGELVQIMMATANENLSAKFCNRVLKFFTKLFQLSKF